MLTTSLAVADALLLPRDSLPLHLDPTGLRTAPGKVFRFISELKVMGAGSTNYPHGEARSRDKAADRRARAVGRDILAAVNGVITPPRHT